VQKTNHNKHNKTRNYNQPPQPQTPTQKTPNQNRMRYNEVGGESMPRPRKKPNPITAKDQMESHEIPHGTPKRTRADKVQTELRTQQVATWLLDGLAVTEVLERGRQKWGLSEYTVKDYVSKAREQIEAVAASELKAAATLAVYRLTDLYQQTIEMGDFRTALEIIKTQNRMLGLNAPEKIETTTIEGWDTMTVSQQLETIERKILTKTKPNEMN
jgi:hypothetical protein